MITLAQQIVTLYIDDSSLRLLVTRGERIKEWAYSPLDRELVQNNVVVDESGLASKIKQLFKAQNIRDRKVVVGLSGLHCLIRPITLPQLPKDMLDEAVRHEAKRVLPVSLEQLYLMWQLIPSPEGQSRAFLIALPHLTIDTMVKTMNQAGLQASFIGVKPLLLAGIVKEATAIIIDVQPTTFDVVAMVNGVPQPRTVQFPDETLPLAKKMGLISNELDRAVNFYNTNNLEDPLDPGVPIFISGELANEPQLYQFLSDKTGRPVLPLQPPFEYPKGLDVNSYLANISLSLHQLQKGRPKDGSSLVTLNSLPSNYQIKQVSMTNVLAMPVAVILAGLLVFLGILNRNAAADIDSMRLQVNTVEQYLQQALSRRDALSEDIAEINQRIEAVQASFHNFEAARNSLKEQNLRINGDLSTTMISLPGTITLNDISHAGTTLEISGTAQGKTDVLSYLMELESSNLFGEIVISRMTKTDDGRMEFALSVNLENQGDTASNNQMVLRYLPFDVSLISVSEANDTMTVNGNSPDENGIVLFLKKLEESNVFREINLSGKTSAEDGGIDFTVTMRRQE
ncbi:PilN domain-containing protein [Chloroflexota bacterium]